MRRLPTYTSALGRVWHYGFLLICAAIFLFLVAPLFIIIPLSFNAESFFTFSDKMLRLDPDGYSLQWYRELFQTRFRPESDVSDWVQAGINSFFIAISATVIATSLGTLAAVGLSRPQMPLRGPIMALLISPMIVPIVITAAGVFLFYSKIGLAYTFPGLILAHAPSVRRLW